MRRIQYEITELAKSQGYNWRNDVRDIQIMLLRIVEEIGECSQLIRKNKDWRKLIGEELADIFIRLAHTCSVLGIDLESEVKKKHKKNMARGYLHGGIRK